MDGLILCEAEDLLWKFLCKHNVGIETFGPHVLILCVFEGFPLLLLCFHIVGIDNVSLQLLDTESHHWIA